MALHELFVNEPMTNFPEVFASTSNRIPILWANMMNTCWSEANLLQLLVFSNIYVSKSNNYWTLMHKTQIRWIKIFLITWKWPNNIQYLSECYSIFASIFTSRSNTSTSNHHFFALSTIRLRLQRFAIRFNDESRSGTPLNRNMSFKRLSNESNACWYH